MGDELSGQPVQRDRTSIEAAAQVVATLVANGVRDVVLCPGSRSAPLAYAAQRAEADGLIRLHVRHDERTAGFLALGCGRGDPEHPAAVITTSGTAVANLLPAALEARHGGVPLLLVSADRPLRLRGTWANQTSDLQAGLLGAVPRWSVDTEPATLTEAELGGLVDEAVDVSLGLGGSGPGPGPVHLNLCFDDPLQPEPGASVSLPTVSLRVRPFARARRDEVVLPTGARTVVIAGDGAGPAARALAEEGGWPLLAEPTSGSRSGDNLVSGYRLVLGRPDLAAATQRVVVYGRPTLSRPVTRLLDDPLVELVQVVGPDEQLGPARERLVVSGRLRASSRVPTEADSGWLRAWREAGRSSIRQVWEVLDDWPRLTGPQVARAVLRATAPGDALVLGASNPVRDADLAGGEVAPGALVLANRGLAGIDGTLSTALGVAVASGRPTRVFLGDLTFLHDLSALAVPAVERGRVRLQVVVLNDDGGGIFSVLEHATHPEPFERVFGTPTGADLARLATGFGARHRTVYTSGELDEGVAAVAAGIEVIEVPACRGDLQPLARRFTAG